MRFEAIVVGGGHAGCEAALALARLGFSCALVTANPARIAVMSCNPAVGGQAKGHIVREIDALGGEMARVADATAIQFRRLNAAKGPAVRSSRVQSDMDLYAAEMQRVVTKQPGLTVVEGMVDALIFEGGRLAGVELAGGTSLFAGGVVLTTGTFLGGLLYVGQEVTPGGRIDDPPAVKLSASLRAAGIELGRLKTGTTPRLLAASIDFSGLEVQPGDERIVPFSRKTLRYELPQLPCHITHTNERTHDAIRSGLDRSPLYTGMIAGRGPRYCPSIEDKIVRFADKARHQIFLEPQGLTNPLVYPNGTSTSLPRDVQERYIRTIPGLENAEIIQYGYAVDYDYVPPRGLKPSLETHAVPGLFCAGQINGTSGYEEAAGQGLWAGINLARKLRGLPAMILRRDQAYLGVLIDDLTTLGTEEPYRMFTSRAEFRLLLREDNAHLRLTPTGREVGLVPAEEAERVEEERRLLTEEVARIRSLNIPASPELSRFLAEKGGADVEQAVPAARLLKRPEIDFTDWPRLDATFAAIPEFIREMAEIELKYEGYIERAARLAERLRTLEEMRIPEDFDPGVVSGLSREVVEKLRRLKPGTAAQAGRISGVTPAAVSAIILYVERNRRLKAAEREAGKQP